MWLLMLVIVLAFIFGMLLVIGLTAPTQDKHLLNYRIDSIARNLGDDLDSIPSLADAEMDASFSERIIRPALRRISMFATRMTPAGATDETRALLQKAGNPGRIGVAEFIGIKIVVFIVFIGVGIVVQLMVDDITYRIMLLILCIVIGYAAPDTYVQSLIRERANLIKKKLPDTIDLLIVSVEAGLGFDQAVAKVVEKVTGPIAIEFGRALDEMRLGKQRSRALKDMAARMDIQEVSTFVAAITQSEQLGVSISTVLRVQSESIRVARAQAIREAAAKLPVLMLIPLVFFIFPSIFVVLLGPGLINIMKSLGGS